jgi:uncharacterized protein
MSKSIVPFRQFVLKAASTCDLACDHCYVYEHRDQSWRDRPRVMPEEVAACAAARIAEHAAAHGLTDVQVVLHGGEPLLAGADRLGRVIRELRRALDGLTRLDLRIHTNGVRLDEDFCRLFHRHHVKVGVSIDGDRRANDRHRLFRNGKSSHARVIEAIDLLRSRYRHLYAGLLCTIDIRNDPLAVYHALRRLEPPRVDFLFPHATWDHPPARVPGRGTDYADWTLAVHDEWVADGRPFAVRIFDSIALLGQGRAGRTEALGLSASDLVVIEADGAYEQVDSLKTAFEGAPATGMNVVDHSLDDVAGHPGIRMRQGGVEALAARCRGCPIVRTCGGGLFAHRYRSGSGFANPSVYCPDLQVLIPRVQQAAAPVHRLSQETLDLFAAAAAGPREVARLHGPRQSLTRMRLATTGGRPGNRTALALLVRLDRERRTALDQVVEHPYVQRWAAWHERTGGAPAHLAAVAAAAAVRAGEPIEVTVPVVAGTACLPGLGRIRAGGRQEVTVRVTGPSSFLLCVEDEWLDHRDGRWEPVREITAAGTTFVVDDVDPFRDCFPLAVRDHLTDTEFGAWEDSFRRAWEWLSSTHPALAAAVRAGLKVVTPARGRPGDGACARDAHSALALCECGDPVALARVIVRESHRSWLNALLDMYLLTGGEAEAEQLSDAYGALALTRLDDPAGGDLLGLESALARLGLVEWPEMGRRFVTRMSIAAGARERAPG